MNDAIVTLETPILDETPIEAEITQELEPDPAEAQTADAELDRLLAVVKDPLCKLAIVVHRIRDRQLFKPLGFESFEVYIASKRLQFSRSFVFQLAKVGKMLEASGIDPLELPERDLEITKLAQIARLPDAAEQRRVVETGYFHVGDMERPLSEIPVRELTGHVDRRLGREPRSNRSRTLSETYDESSGWQGPERFDDDPPGTAVQSASFQEMRIPSPTVAWKPLLDDLAAAIRPLDGPDRDDAINALSRLYQELVGF